MSMKVVSESVPQQETWLKPLEFDLPAGLIGFADLRRVELIVNPEAIWWPEESRSYKM